MATRLKSKAKPALLRWARESARLSLEDAAARTGVSTSTLELWEQGSDAPTIPQLRKLGVVYRRPIIVFYLASPPKDFDALHDFRRLTTGTRSESPELAAQIRWAYEMREVAIEALRSIEALPPPWRLHATVKEPAEVVGIRLLETLGVTQQQRENWKTPYDPYHAWRAAIERLGVLCFQISSVDIVEARGFSIGQHPLPVIAVNAADAVAGRVFTLLHEFVHLTIGNAGTCDLQENSGEHLDVEVFCNAVAAEILVPSEQFRAEPLVRDLRGVRNWTDREIESLASMYRVSREVILRRLLTFGFATSQFYQAKRDEFAAAERKSTKPGGGNYYSNQKVKLGVPLIQGVLNAYHLGRITANEAAGYLRVKVDHLSKLLANQ